MFVLFTVKQSWCFVQDKNNIRGRKWHTYNITEEHAVCVIALITIWYQYDKNGFGPGLYLTSLNVLYNSFYAIDG